MANTDRARKLLVRTALATSSTIATLIGAQSLAMLDTAQFQQDAAPTAAETAAITSAAPNVGIVSVAPGITILRQSGQRPLAHSSSAALNPSPAIAANPSSGIVIQPPNPVQIAGPTIVQQPFALRTRSSR